MQTNPEENESLNRNILTSVSHDLKTPLACIIGSLEIVERAKDKLTPEKRNILLNTALQEAYRLNGFITNILDMAKFEQGMVKPLLQSHEMKLLLKDCLTMMGLRLEGCNVQIIEPAVPVILMTDYVLLSRAICILLDNAAKYCSDNSIIEIEYERIGEQVIILIKDNGPGIPDSKMEEIFSKYSRISKQDYQIAGTGLGLPICREIMNLLGGAITVANIEGGKGAMFTLAFAG
jgi:K+-sensing histidine kinase KdpD